MKCDRTSGANRFWGAPQGAEYNTFSCLITIDKLRMRNWGGKEDGSEFHGKVERLEVSVSLAGLCIAAVWPASFFKAAWGH